MNELAGNGSILGKAYTVRPSANLAIHDFFDSLNEMLSMLGMSRSEFEKQFVYSIYSTANRTDIPGLEKVSDLLFDKWNTASVKPYYLPEFVRTVVQECGKEIPPFTLSLTNDNFVNTLEIHGRAAKVFTATNSLKKCMRDLQGKALKGLNGHYHDLFGVVVRPASSPVSNKGISGILYTFLPGSITKGPPPLYDPTPFSRTLQKIADNDKSHLSMLRNPTILAKHNGFQISLESPIDQMAIQIPVLLDFLANEKIKEPDGLQRFKALQDDMFRATSALALGYDNATYRDVKYYRDTPDKETPAPSKSGKKESEFPEPYTLTKDRHAAACWLREQAGEPWKNLRDTQAAKRFQLADHVWAQEFAPLLNALNTNVASHITIGDAVFADEAMKRAITALTPDWNQLKERDRKRLEPHYLTNSKHETQKEHVKNMLAALPEQDEIKQLVLHSPHILAALSGNKALIDRVHRLDTENLLVSLQTAPSDANYKGRKDNYTKEKGSLLQEIWQYLDLEVALPDVPIPLTPLESLPAEPSPPATIAPTAPEIVPAPAPPPTIIPPPPVVIYPPSSVKPKPVVLQPPLRYVPPFITEEALRNTCIALMAEMEDAIIESFDAGYNRVRFDMRPSHGQMKFALMMTNPANDSKEFLFPAQRDLSHAVDQLQSEQLFHLKIALQSYVLNQSGLEPHRTLYLGNETSGIRYHDPMPYYAGDPKKTIYKTVNASGMHSLTVTATDREDPASGEKPEPLTAHIPLGLKTTPANKAEAEVRAEKVQKYLAQMHSQKQRVTKSDLMDWLQQEVQKTHGIWERQEITSLPNYEDPHTLKAPPGAPPIICSTARLHFEEGINPTYRLKFNLHQDDKYVGAKGLNLHTSNEKLAHARAQKAMQELEYVLYDLRNNQLGQWAAEHLGKMDGTPAYVQEVVELGARVRSDEGIVQKIIQDFRDAKVGIDENSIRTYMNTIPPETYASSEVMKKILSASITRYADDLSIRAEHPGADVTLSVFRGSNNAILKRTRHEVLPSTLEQYYAENDLPMQLIVSMPDSFSKAQIDQFIYRVNTEFMAQIGDRYSSIALEPDEPLKMSAHMARTAKRASVQNRQAELNIFRDTISRIAREMRIPCESITDNMPRVLSKKEPHARVRRHFLYSMPVMHETIPKAE